MLRVRIEQQAGSLSTTSVCVRYQIILLKPVLRKRARPRQGEPWLIDSKTPQSLLRISGARSKEPGLQIIGCWWSSPSSIARFKHMRRVVSPCSGCLREGLGYTAGSLTDVCKVSGELGLSKCVLTFGLTNMWFNTVWWPSVRVQHFGSTQFEETTTQLRHSANSVWTIRSAFVWQIWPAGSIRLRSGSQKSSHDVYCSAG